MEYSASLDIFPMWGFFVFPVLLSMIAWEIGFRIGRYQFRKHPETANIPMDYMIGAAFGLLAFMLSFTFSFTANIHSERRQAVLNEANAIGTTYLRSGYLEEPYKSEVRSLLKKYLDIRLDVIKTRKFKEALEETDIIQNQLWDQVVLIVQKKPDSESTSLFIASMNDLIDLHATRILLNFGMRLPNIIWFTLFFIISVSMWALGYQSGFKNTRSFGVNLAVVIAFSSVIYLISDLEHPQRGFLKTTQQPLIGTLNKMMESQNEKN